MADTPTIGSLSGTVVTIPCKTCTKGEMSRQRVPRFGTFLEVVGALMIAISGFGLLAAAGVLMLFLTAGARTSVNLVERKQSETIQAIRMAGVEEVYIEEYRKTGKISDGSRNQMPLAQSQAVERIMKTEAAGTAGGAIGIGIGTSFGIGLAGVIGLPSFFFFLLGLLFCIRKKVWWCSTCNSAMPLST